MTTPSATKRAAATGVIIEREEPSQTSTGEELLSILVENGAAKLTSGTSATKLPSVASANESSSSTTVEKNPDTSTSQSGHVGCLAPTMTSARTQSLAGKPDTEPANTTRKSVVDERNRQTLDAAVAASSSEPPIEVSESEPGAFASVPGNEDVRQDTVSFSLLRRDASTDNFPNQDELGLSEAVPVNDHLGPENLPGAVPMDHAARKRQHVKSAQQLRTLLGLLGLFLTLIVVIVTVVIASASDAGSSESPSLRATQVTPKPPATPLEDNVDTLWPTPAPTFLIPKDLLLNTTMEAILYPLSPQSMAYQCVLYNMMEQKYVMVERKTNETTCNSLGRFTKLKLIVPGNPSDLQGAMPPEIALLPNLEQIYLHAIGFNKPMSAAVIPQMKHLSNLRKLYYSRNGITGTIPSSTFEILPSHTLEEFSLIEPDLNGTIPSTVHGLSNLKKLSLSGNLTGTIPSEIGLLASLEYLFLGHNHDLQGTIPIELLELTNLETLRLDQTALTETLPDVGQWNNLTELQVEAQLAGTIPGSLEDLAKLQICILNNNEFTGTLPPLHPMAPLERLEVESNQITGSIPEAWFDASSFHSSLLYLDLSDNLLTGVIPDSIWSLTKLRTLDLANNAGLSGLSGSIPSEIAQCSSLRYLQMDNTGISGLIPSELGLLSRLELLLLHGTNLSGSVPTEVCMLKDEGRLHELHVNCTTVTCDCDCTCS
ncbi:Leucine rich repeat N-terminal domain [Seminavis robusta]|uniref:Leucine rich repeat N-terminal domain n=1 Tax=Seminavis robusta TaxID=568900 RepID=A0A9N8HRR0_9STRA|nr:Leucine rich repeat N-terminal domain [Seminavis robusta]|eukprot:Sro1300_g260730.1 Leucine rich repeat N-terminal domain (713) ;mRNA; r:11337-13940